MVPVSLTLPCTDEGDTNLVSNTKPSPELNSTVVSSAEPVPHKLFRRVWIALVLALGIFIGAGLLLWFRTAPVPQMVTSIIKLEPGYALDGMCWRNGVPTRTALAISRDGSFIVYSASAENPVGNATPHLFLRRMDQQNATLLKGTEGGLNPFLSPDNQWVGFFATWKLWKMRIDGGPPTSLCDSQNSAGASWGSDNSIVFCKPKSAALAKVSADGGNAGYRVSPSPELDEGTRAPRPRRKPVNTKGNTPFL